MLRALILDFGGTIVTMDGKADSARQIAAELDIPQDQMMSVVMGHPDWTDAMLGKYTIEEFDQRLYARLGKTYDPTRYPVIYRMFADEVLSTNLLVVADEIRAANGKAAILSNATFDLEERLLGHKFGIIDKANWGEYEELSVAGQLPEEQPVPLKTGSCSFHHGLILHSSRPNLTDQRRRGYATHYVSAHCRYTGDPAKNDALLVRGQSMSGRI